MIYITKFLKFTGIMLVIITLTTANAMFFTWADGNITYIFLYLMAIMMTIVIIDVQVDKMLQKRRDKMKKEIDEEFAKLDEIIKSVYKEKRNE